MLHSSCVCSDTGQDFDTFIAYKNESVFRRFEGTIIGKCRQCGMLKTFPPSSTSFNPKQSRTKMYENCREKFTLLFAPIIAMILKSKKKGVVLDVGCSSGLLMELLKEKGFDVYGVEPNKQAYEKTHRTFDNHVHHGTLNTFLSAADSKPKIPSRFDIVIYNHVLEHIEDIKNEIDAMKKVLKQNGILIIGLPNISNVIFRIRNKYWEPLMPKEHVWHFSFKHMKSLLERNGLAIQDIEYTDDQRLDYPLLKRLYFSVLSTGNRIFHTGEAMLISARKIQNARR